MTRGTPSRDAGTPRCEGYGCRWAFVVSVFLAFVPTGLAQPAPAGKASLEALVEKLYGEARKERHYYR